MNVEEFWGPWEAEAETFDDVSAHIYDVSEKWPGRLFAWRGQTDASWPLHSSLYRRLCWSKATQTPREPDLLEAERKVLADLHRWGLHMGEYGRLSVTHQLAMLQHYGAPTRLVDITFNPWIGLWFAVQSRQADGADLPATDTRLFAFDVTDRLINERGDEYRSWEDDLRIPWPRRPENGAGPQEREAYKAWTTSVFAWRPPRFHPRLAAQNGGFLFGGVPATGGQIYWPKSTQANAARWTIDEVRQATSLPLRMHKLEAAAGAPPAGAMYTVRIKAAGVTPIRKRLQDLFGYEPLTLYPDYTGFAEFGTPSLRRTPPPPQQAE